MILQARDESGLGVGLGWLWWQRWREVEEVTESLALITSKARPREYSFHVGAFIMAKTRGRASHPALLLHLLRPAIGTFSRTHCPLLASDLHRAPEGQTLAFYKLPFHPCHTGTHRGRCVTTQTDPTAESFPYRPLPKVRVC